jgi:uncharacterized protein YbbC (DUF1343 family)
MLGTLLIIFSFCNNSPQLSQPLKFGIEVLIENKFELLQGKRVGLITNQTGVDSKGNHIIDLFYSSSDFELTALFSPEHGIRGDIEGGFEIVNNKDEKTGVPIFSIYGKTTKPTKEMLQKIDVLVFDIQDVGTRFYTYISTMSLCMEAAAENNIRFIVLDRPNPINGAKVEGPVLETKYRSFVGIHPIALRHGMTVGELAKMFNEEGWLANGIKADLTILTMENWKRYSFYDELGLDWIKPSPNMPSPTTALLYPGMGLLETCNVSEGRGTSKPFVNIGAPWLDNIALKKYLDDTAITGIKIDTISYIPIDMPGAVMNPKFEGERCQGLIFEITDARGFPSVEFGIHLIYRIKQNHPDKFRWKSERRVLNMFGDTKTRRAMDEAESAYEVIHTWHADLEKFNKIRKKYLLYE